MSFVSTALSSLNNANVTNVLSSVGGIVTGIGQLKNAKSDISVGNYNADIYNQNAQAARQSQELLEVQKRRNLKSIISSQKAIYGSSGIKLSGSPLEVMADSIKNANMDIAIDKYNSEVQARGYENQAQLEKYQAKQKSAINYAKATSTFLSTAAGLYQTQKLGGTPQYGPYGGKMTSSGPISYLPKKGK